MFKFWYDVVNSLTDDYIIFEYADQLGVAVNAIFPTYGRPFKYEFHYYDNAGEFLTKEERDYPGAIAPPEAYFVKVNVWSYRVGNSRPVGQLWDGGKHRIK